MSVGPIVDKFLSMSRKYESEKRERINSIDSSEEGTLVSEVDSSELELSLLPVSEIVVT